MASAGKGWDRILTVTVAGLHAALLVMGIGLAPSALGGELPDGLRPRQVVLTWQRDPSTTMTITWRTDERSSLHTLRYAADSDSEGRDWKTRVATTFTFQETRAWLHTVELADLEPGRTYHVEIEHPGHPDRFHFVTLPDAANRRELIFLVGGDSRSRREVRREMNERAAGTNPDFVIFDGDFINTALSEEQWDEWFDDWHEQMITPLGRRIPIVPSIGNHEVSGAYLQPREKAPFYLNRFIVPEPRNHYVMPLGPDVVLVTLDSDHLTEVTAQSSWLDSTLEAHRDLRWKLVQYHVAAWPSVRDFDGAVPAKIREHWIPLFEKHDVGLVIEAHDHAYKRTVPIRGNREDREKGIVYIGDGGWGAPVRETKKAADYWWLEEAAMIDHFWKVTVSADGRDMQFEPAFRFFTAQPASQSVAPGGSVTLTAAASGNPPQAFQWKKNGTVIAGATGSSYTIGSVQPADAGLYSVITTSTMGTATSTPAVLAPVIAQKVAGAAVEFEANIRHPNGRLYDQLLLTGPAATFTADAGQVSRISYVDLNDDIVQVEFSGAGSVTLVLDSASGPALPIKYNQAVNYMKGHASLYLANTDGSSHISVFTVGRMTAYDPTGGYDIGRPPDEANRPSNNRNPIFKDEAVYDGVADLGLLAIMSPGSVFGNVLTGNAGYWRDRGHTGIYAPGVVFTGDRVYLHELTALGTAIPVLHVGGASDVRVAGGCLRQDNLGAVVIKGFTALRFADGTDSHGRLQPAQANQARLEENGVDVTDRRVTGGAP